jgi:hypothetical protein
MGNGWLNAGAGYPQLRQHMQTQEGFIYGKKTNLRFGPR